MKNDRIRNNLTLAQLALLTGIYPARLSRIERGLCSPREGEARLINELLGAKVFPLGIRGQSRRKVGGK